MAPPLPDLPDALNAPPVPAHPFAKAGGDAYQHMLETTQGYPIQSNANDALSLPATGIIT